MTADLAFPVEEWAAFDRMRACVHEAGHAVVAWAVGLPVQQLSVRQGWWSGAMEGFILLKRDPDNDDPNEVFAFLETCAAGGIAEELWMSPRLSGRHVASSLKKSCVEDEEMISILAPPNRFSIHAIRFGAERIVVDAFDNICEVAQQLYDSTGNLPGRVAS